MGSVSVLPTRVVVVDDYVMVSEIMALSISKEPDLSLVGIANGDRDAATVLQREHPDVILLNSRAPHGSSVEIIRRLHKESPSSRIVMVSGDGDDVLSREVMEAGCTVIVSNHCSIAEILKAIRVAAPVECGASSGPSHSH
jgi:two-component system response regulator NreC